MRFALLLCTAASFAFAAYGADVLKPLCFATSINPEDPMQLVIWPDGTYERTWIDSGKIDWSDEGTWRSTARDTFLLTSQRTVRDLVVGQLTVSPFVNSNVELLPNLQQAITQFLAQHPTTQSFSPEQLAQVVAKGGTCPSEDAYSCAGTCNGNPHYFLNLRVENPYPERLLKRREIEALLPAIDKYLASPALNVFRVSLLRYKGHVVPIWQPRPPGYGADTSTDDVKQQIERLDVSVGHFRIRMDPGSTRQIPCTSTAAGARIPPSNLTKLTKLAG